MEWWAWLLIILGIVALVALIIGVVMFMSKRSKELKEPTFAQRLREQAAAENAATRDYLKRLQ